MKFDVIIKAAGFKPCTFPRCSNISIKLFDKDGDERTEEIQYEKELFADNLRSANKFFNFICFLETKPVSSLNVMIDTDCVIIYYKAEQFCFRRTKPMDPISYMADYFFMG